MRRIGRLAAAALLALQAPAFAAGKVEVVTPEQSVAGRPGLTYADLLRKIVTDLEVGGSDTAGHQGRGGEIAPFRNILGPNFGGDAPDQVEISVFDAIPFETGGRPRLTLLVDLGESPGRVEHTALLALFDIGAAPRLLDLVDVGMDKSTEVASLPRARLGAGDEALVVSGAHSSSNQRYATYAMVFARDDKWQLIGSFSTLSDSYCAFDRDETPNFATRRQKSEPYAEIVVTVRETEKKTGTDCGAGESPSRNATRDYRATYRWDAAKQRFATDSKALKQLEKLNEKRY
jgi:hypothetical protein